MARIRKDEEFNKKKADIIHSAVKIILEEGANKLSINYLLRKTNLSKGSFFHYFKSKEDLLAEVIHYASQPIVKSMQEVIENKNLNAVAKMTQLYQTAGYTKAKYGKGLGAFSEILYRNENKMFLTEVMDRTFNLCLPILNDLIQEGVNSGYFKVESTQAASYHILTITMRLNQEIGEYLIADDKSGLNKNRLKEKIKLAEQIIRSILNCPEIGTLYQIKTLESMGVL